MQNAFASLEQKFAAINRKLEEKNAELERTVAEKEALKDYLQNILESLTTGVIVTDLKGKITILNRCAELFSGQTQDVVLGKRFKAVFPEALAGEPKTPAGNGIPSGPKPGGRPGRKLRIQDRIVELFSSAVRSAAGEVIGTVHILRDVTRIEKLEEMAKRTEKLAAMGELAVNMAHEIRNPLGSIELFASLLLKDTEHKAQRERLYQIISAVKNVDNKISNLLLFTRRRKPVMRRVNLHRILSEVILFARDIIEQEGISVSAAYAPVRPCVKADQEMLKQIFLNVLLNAIQAMPEGGRIGVSTRVHDGHVEITFSDDGIGIPEENLRRVFDPFFSTKERGTGLGLAIVHNIVALHVGSIEVDSKGEGAVFRIALPVTRTKRSKI
jgi:PAS domain S-box-containing protein